MDLKTLILSITVFLSSFLPISPNPSLLPSNPPIKVEKTSPIEKLSIPPLSLNSIFSPDHSWTEKLPQEKAITLITTGDVIPARSVNWKMTKYNDFTYPFQKTADFLKSADLALINLESPLTNPCPVTQEGMVFCGSQRFIEGLTFAGIDIVNLANNHTGNWGIKGLCQTVELLENNGILSSGLPSNFSCPSLPSNSFSPSSFLTFKGITFGFLGYNILDKPDKEKILQDIRQTKTEVDFLIVSFHWGAEYTHSPAPETIILAHKAISAGADLIAGNHPHWYQPIEIYKEKPIIYAHGNFIFDQEWSQETKTGFLAKFSIYQNKVIDLQIFPIFIHDYSQAYFLEGKGKEKILEDIKHISLQQQKAPEN